LSVIQLTVQNVSHSSVVCVGEGHNWGSVHDYSQECLPTDSQGGKYLMYPYTVTGLDQNNNVRYALFLSLAV